MNTLDTLLNHVFWQLFYSVGKHLSLVLNMLGVVQYTKTVSFSKILQSER